MELSKMFGVERDVDFRVEGYEETLSFKITLNDNGTERLMSKYSDKDKWNIALPDTIFTIISIAPSGIIHLPPPLTDEQREQLRAIWTLGGRWLAKDFDCAVNYFKTKPYKESGNWFARDDGEVYGYPVPLSASVRGLQELNRVDEPYDIGKALGGGGMTGLIIDSFAGCGQGHDGLKERV
jgi:hypothetical protein